MAKHVERASPTASTFVLLRLLLWILLLVFFPRCLFSPVLLCSCQLRAEELVGQTARYAPDMRAHGKTLRGEHLQGACCSLHDVSSSRCVGRECTRKVWLPFCGIPLVADSALNTNTLPVLSLTRSFQRMKSSTWWW